MARFSWQSITTSQHARRGSVYHHRSPCHSLGHLYSRCPCHHHRHRHAKPSHMAASPHLPARSPPSAPPSQHFVHDIQPGHRQHDGPAAFSSARIPATVPDLAASSSAQAVGCSSESPDKHVEILPTSPTAGLREVVFVIEKEGTGWAWEWELKPGRSRGKRYKKGMESRGDGGVGRAWSAPMWSCCLTTVVRTEADSSSAANFPHELELVPASPWVSLARW